MKLKVLAPFYRDADFIEALWQSAPVLQDFPKDAHLVFSYHGLPVSHLVKADPKGQHCMKTSGCCDREGPWSPTCYRQQAMVTSRLLAQKMGLPGDRWSVAWQSRVGRNRWLEPELLGHVERLAASGVRHLVLMCPSFVADCLETLEELDMGVRDAFLEAGGEQFERVPCLNDHPVWVDMLARRISTPLPASCRH
jgi:ferrochelatase